MLAREGMMMTKKRIKINKMIWTECKVGLERKGSKPKNVRSPRKQLITKREESSGSKVKQISRGCAGHTSRR